MTKKNQIIEQAERLFLTHRIQQVTTMDDLAAVLQSSKKTIYKHFDSKTDLIIEVFGRFNSKTKETFEAIYKSDVSLLDRVTKIVAQINCTVSFIYGAGFHLYHYNPRIMAQYGILKENVFEYYLLSAIKPFYPILNTYDLSIAGFTAYIITDIEKHQEQVHQKEMMDFKYPETLIFLIQRTLMGQDKEQNN